VRCDHLAGNADVVGESVGTNPASAAVVYYTSSD